MINSPKGPENNTHLSDSPLYESWVIRNGFSHGGMALLWIFVAFLLFQVFTNILGIGLIFIRASGDMQSFNAQELTALVAQNIDLLFIANTAGQILFLGLSTWYISRLHAKKTHRPAFLRLRTNSSTTRILAIAFILMLVVQPAIWFLGWLNTFLPVPDVMEAMQLQQMEMIESYLTGKGMVLVALFNIALVPAVCEEILFRGYVLRSFEKSWGIMWAIIISGIIFGFYHLQLSNVLPLASIGVLLAILTWVSQSIYPAMLAHFVNNGASVLVAKYYPETAFSELSPATMPPLWLVGVSVVVSGYLIYWLINDTNNIKRGADAARS